MPLEWARIQTKWPELYNSSQTWHGCSWKFHVEINACTAKKGSEKSLTEVLKCTTNTDYLNLKTSFVDLNLTAIVVYQHLWLDYLFPNFSSSPLYICTCNFEAILFNCGIHSWSMTKTFHGLSFDWAITIRSPKSCGCICIVLKAIFAPTCWNELSSRFL